MRVGGVLVGVRRRRRRPRPTRGSASRSRLEDLLVLQAGVVAADHDPQLVIGVSLQLVSSSRQRATAHSPATSRPRRGCRRCARPAVGPGPPSAAGRRCSCGRLLATSADASQAGASRFRRRPAASKSRRTVRARRASSCRRGAAPPRLPRVVPGAERRGDVAIAGVPVSPSRGGRRRARRPTARRTCRRPWPPMRRRPRSSTAAVPAAVGGRRGAAAAAAADALDHAAAVVAVAGDGVDPAQLVLGGDHRAAAMAAKAPGDDRPHAAAASRASAGCGRSTSATGRRLARVGRAARRRRPLR